MTTTNRDAIAGYGVQGGHLTLDGRDLVALAGEYGSPLFVFSERRLRANAAAFLAAARNGHPSSTVCYASKACSNIHVLKILRSEGLAIEVNSGGELHKALYAGFAPSEIVFNGVSKSTTELDWSIELGIKAINVDSVFELERIARLAHARSARAKVSLRLVPSLTGGAFASIQTGNAKTKFGMTQADLPELLRLLAAHSQALDPVGLHLHIGSQVAETASFLGAVEFAAGAAATLAAAIGRPFAHVNLGGGYPIEYRHRRGNDPVLERYGAPERAATMVEAVAAAMSRKLSGDTELLFEPGRAIVGDTAVLLSRVENQKHRGEQPWLYLDAGYNMLLDLAVTRWYYHMATANRADEAARTEFRLVGPLCDSADCFYDTEGEYLLPKLQQRFGMDLDEALTADILHLPPTRAMAASTAPGDLVAIFDVGAYTLSEMFTYCGRPRAAAVMVKLDGSIASLRRRDSYQDLLAQEMEPADRT
ncbi:MAG TPA: diaminopimelate decarboxylase [Hypericibacter adhaerens]|uniref:diaminopimelate decarboxylase n=1 Tax=Hypericibacter adhaerens TaxID=2602016 RepID=UPI002BC1BB4D|nr:diaminopimelate decarboxylase [Hypericibacter adhaerens]HWA44530.1 diaminopimelate decarboxylase [Hypericibacter adhaerens]